MSAADTPRYRFATQGQWASCVAARLACELTLDACAGPVVAEFAAPPSGIAAADDGEPVWVADGVLRRGDCATHNVGNIERLVIGGDRIWVLTANLILALNRESFQLHEQFARGDVIDIAASGGRDGVWFLRPAGPARPERVPVGPPAEQPYDAGWRLAVAGDRLLLLHTASGTIRLVDGGTGAVLREFSLPDTFVLAGQSFRAAAMRSGKGAVLLVGEWAGVDGGAGEPGFVVVDGEGDPTILGRWHRDTPLIVIAAGEYLLALFAEDDGQLRLRRFADRSVAGGERRITPLLESETLEGRWMLARIRASLPEGATLSLRWAATRDEALAVSLRAVIANPAARGSEKLAMLRRVTDDRWSHAVTYIGVRRDGFEAGPAPLESFVFPLHAADGNFLWAEASILPGVGGEPGLSEMEFLHDGRALRDELPAVFRGPSGDGDGTLARLVATLEGTTRPIDEIIARLGDWLDPDRTPARWLPRLAAMLDIPFDAVLGETAQRNLVRAAAALLGGRGTRAGLVTLLEAIVPDRPIAVEDRTGLLAPLTLGAAMLPAMLTGPSPRVPRLGARLVLGRTALCSASPCEDGSPRPGPQVLVTIPATPAERRRYGATIARLIEAMLPAPVRLIIRWPRWTGAPPNASPVLHMPPDPQPLRLGDGQALGLGRLGGDTRARLTERGIGMGHRLD